MRRLDFELVFEEPLKSGLVSVHLMSLTCLESMLVYTSSSYLNSYHVQTLPSLSPICIALIAIKSCGAEYLRLKFRNHVGCMLKRARTHLSIFLKAIKTNLVLAHLFRF